MSDEEKLQAFTIMRINNLRSKDVAKVIGVSASMLSQHLNINSDVNLSKSKEEKLQRYLEELDNL